MRARERSRFPVDQRRAQLVRIGEREFSHRPYDAVSIEEIAAAAGISKGLLYHYFPSKRDFYVAVIEAAAAELREVTEPDPELHDLERLRSSVDAYLDYVEQHAEAYVALMRGGIGADDQVRDIVDETRTVVVGRVLAGLALDDSPGALLRLTVRGWVGLVEAASLDWLERRDTPRWKLRDLLVGSLVALIAVAADLDPGACRARGPRPGDSWLAG